MPVVSVQCDYKKPLRYGNSVIVETTYVPTAAAKLHFKYTMFESVTRDVVAVGSSVQVFVDVKTFGLQFVMPSFFESWRNRWNV